MLLEEAVACPIPTAHLSLRRAVKQQNSVFPPLPVETAGTGRLAEIREKWGIQSNLFKCMVTVRNHSLPSKSLWLHAFRNEAIWNFQKLTVSGALPSEALETPCLCVLSYASQLPGCNVWTINWCQPCVHLGHVNMMCDRCVRSCHGIARWVRLRVGKIASKQIYLCVWLDRHVLQKTWVVVLRLKVIVQKFSRSIQLRVVHESKGFQGTAVSLGLFFWQRSSFAFWVVAFCIQEYHSFVKVGGAPPALLCRLTPL